MRVRHRVLSRLSAIVALVVFSACDSNRLTEPPAPPPPAAEPGGVSTIIITPNSADMAVGDLVKLQARAYDQFGTLIQGRDIQWTSAGSRTRVANDGVMEGVRQGDDTVYASLDGKAGKSVVRVFNGRVAAVLVSLDPSTVEVGQPSQATADLYRNNGDLVSGNVYWTSSNTQVATIDSTGRISTLRAGQTTIKAVSEGKTDSEVLTVVPGEDPNPAVASVTVTASTSLLYVGSSTTLSAVAKDSQGRTVTGVEFVWASSQPAVATVNSSGLVTGISAGTVSFTATAGDKSGGTSLTVSPVPVNAMSISLSPTSVYVGGTSTASVRHYDSEGNLLDDRYVEYSSSNPSVARVDGNGLVTGLIAGSASITARSEGKSASATISVGNVPTVSVASVSVTLGSASLNPGATTQALAVPYDAGGSALTGRSISWSSSNTAVATVNASGLVTAVAAGTASIRATVEGKVGSATLTVASPVVEIASISVTLQDASLNVGHLTQAFAVPRDADGNALTGRTIQWSSSNTGVATVNNSGQVTAVEGGTASIVATSEGKTGTASLTVSSSVTITGLDITPASATLSAGATQTFSAMGTYSDGGSGVVSVNWSATGGTITQQGVYTAGQTAGSFLVIAMCSCGLSDSSTVSVTTAPAPSLEPAAVTVSPETRTMSPGETYQFIAQGWLSGSSEPITTPVEWTATGGTVDQNGRYTAGNVGGTYVVRARSTMISWRVDSAMVTINAPTAPTPPAATVQSFSLSPANVSLFTLGSVQFQTATTWSDGVSRSVSVSYNVTGGTISLGGLYTAGSATGSYRVIANCDCGRSDTSYVTISLSTAPPPSGSVAPYASDDFSTYTSKSQMLSSSLYGGTDNPAQIALDETVGFGSSGKSMRYDFPDRTAEGTTTGYDGYCTSYVISRSPTVPSGTKHMWSEVWVRFDAHFVVRAPSEWGCKSGADYKFLFATVRPNAAGQYGRFQMDMPGWKWVVAYPSMPGGDESLQSPQIPASTVPSALWDGKWHRVRMETRLSTTSDSPDGLVRQWVDDVLIWEKVGVVIDRPSFYGIALGANMNQGPAIPQSIWWGKWSIWLTNPGW